MRNLLILLALLAVPLGQAQFNDPMPYEGDGKYLTDLNGLPGFVSGALDYRGEGAQNGTMFLGTSGVTVTGMDEICWREGFSAQCRSGSDLRLELLDGGSVAFRTPRSYDVEMQAGHVLAFFGDAGVMFGENRPEQLEYGPSIIAFPTQEEITITNVERIPPPSPRQYTDFNDAGRDLALMVTLTDASTFVIRDGDTTAATLEGNGHWVGFHGSPKFTPVNANLAAIPMPEGTTASFTPSPPRAAREGLSPETLQAATASLAEAEGDQDAQALGGATDAADALAGFLNGALLNFDDADLQGEVSGLELLERVTLVRFQEMDATRTNSAISYQGAAPLQITEGEVAGAQPLIGFAPLLAYIFWGVALVAFVLRVVLKPSKKNALWDRLHFVGWFSSAAAGVLVFFLWDRAMVQLWGTSILTSGATGATLGVITAIQLVPLLLAALFFGLPVRIITQSVTRFAGQGRMMNLGNTLAPFAAYIFGVPLLLSLVGALIEFATGA